MSDEDVIKRLSEKNERLKADLDDLERKVVSHDKELLLGEIHHLFSIPVISPKGGQAVSDAVDVLKRCVEEML
ncbi:MAG: hypothetical protein PQJ60_10830 [Spirochaetales bacterium]|nr:hypothetical protein [Spirochaetales bacterium]